jgi:hypothetical protein
MDYRYQYGVPEADPMDATVQGGPKVTIRDVRDKQHFGISPSN